MAGNRREQVVPACYRDHSAAYRLSEVSRDHYRNSSQRVCYHPSLEQGPMLSFLRSTWQDWGLRCSRKTAFHAAVQYYCRQLGIVGYESAIPVVYADPDSQDYTPANLRDLDNTSATSGDAPNSPSGLSIPIGAPTQTQADAADQMKPTLGFLPPPAVRSAHMRARKSLSKKAILRGMDG